MDFLDRFCRANTQILVDPVMGDQGCGYDIYTEELCEKMRMFAKRAQVITPNLTEALLLLYGKEEMEKQWESLSKKSGKEFLEDIEKISEALEKNFSVQTPVITGIDYKEEKKPLQMGNLVREKGQMTWIFSNKEGGSYSGTGDLFASVLSAGMVKGVSMTDCVKKAVRFLSLSISDAVAEGQDRNDGVCFETHLNELWK